MWRKWKKPGVFLHSSYALGWVDGDFNRRLGLCSLSFCLRDSAWQGRKQIPERLETLGLCSRKTLKLNEYFWLGLGRKPPSWVICACYQSTLFSFPHPSLWKRGHGVRWVEALPRLLLLSQLRKQMSPKWFYHPSVVSEIWKSLFLFSVPLEGVWTVHRGSRNQKKPTTSWSFLSAQIFVALLKTELRFSLAWRVPGLWDCLVALRWPFLPLRNFPLEYR